MDLIEKRKRLDFLVLVSERTSDLPVYLLDLDTKPIMPNVNFSVIPCVTPDLIEIADLGFVVCPFNLGIVAEFA